MMPEGNNCWEYMAEGESREEKELYAVAANLPVQQKRSLDKGGEVEGAEEGVGLRYHFRIAQGVEALNWKA